MQARLRGWFIAICATTLVGLLIVTDPVTLHTRNHPGTSRPMRPLARLWKLYLYPPVPDVRLGLDLQGGSHIVLRARNQAVLSYSFGSNLAQTEDGEGEVQAQVRDLLAANGIQNPTVGVSKRELTVRAEVPTRDELDAFASHLTTLLKDHFGKHHGTMTLADKEYISLQGDRLGDVRLRLERRVNEFGLTETVVQPQQPDRIIIEMPGTEDPTEVLDKLQKTAVLEFAHIPRKYTPEVDRDPDTGRETTWFTDRSGKEVPTEKVLAESKIIVRGDQLKDNAHVDYDPSDRSPVVAFEFRPEGGEKFHEFTRTHRGHFLAIVLDGDVISAPKVQAAIRRKGIITGGFASVAEATQLSNLLNAGSLEVPLEVAESRIVSPTLGKDSLYRSLWAGLFGLLAVMVFMALYYKVPGLLANLALIIYCLLVLAVLKIFNATLTLPGIAGIILSIGMAVDANIIIFERLKEELWAEKTLRSAIEAGFKRAWTAILDSNVCSIGTAIVLFIVGTAPVKGFAITLLIGVATSLFTAVTVTRLFMILTANTRLARNLSWFGA
jgi:preprotein translocase subunit SecD